MRMLVNISKNKCEEMSRKWGKLRAEIAVFEELLMDTKVLSLVPPFSKPLTCAIDRKHYLGTKLTKFTCLLNKVNGFWFALY
jgi:hypothetical protein